MQLKLYSTHCKCLYATWSRANIAILWLELHVTTDQSLVGHAPLEEGQLFVLQMSSALPTRTTMRSVNKLNPFLHNKKHSPQDSLMIAITRPGGQRWHIPYLLLLLLPLPLLLLLLLSAVLFANTDYVCMHASVQELCPNKDSPTHTHTHRQDSLSSAAQLCAVDNGSYA